MSKVIELIQATSSQIRQQFIISSFTDYYSHLMTNDSAAWRGKFRKMAQSPFAFYRGSATLFYADVARDKDRFLNDQTSRVWIQGDLHASNFGTYMNSAGVLVFDVNDFDEAFVGPFTWDVKRLAASLALIGYAKALSDLEIRKVVAQMAQGYAQQIARFVKDEDSNLGLTIANTTGKVQQVLQAARRLTRIDLLNGDTEIVDGDRRFQTDKNSPRADDATRMKLETALKDYQATIPLGKRRAKINYKVKDVVQRKAMGVGSAGLPMYSILLEGETQALENDLILSFKQAQSAAPSHHIHDERVHQYFLHDGHRTVISQRALQSYADPLLGYTTLDGKGMLVAEVNPYSADLDWNDINDLEDILQVAEALGRCVAKIHCCSDDDSDQTLITYSAEAVIHAVLDGQEADFIADITDFGESYGAIVRQDHSLFVDAFRNHLFPGI